MSETKYCESGTHVWGTFVIQYANTKMYSVLKKCSKCPSVFEMVESSLP